MKPTFDFQGARRRMPYTVPDGFFDTMEQNLRTKMALPAGSAEVARELQPKAVRRRTAGVWRVVLKTGIAAAIAVGLFFAARLRPQRPADTFAAVELAFGSLSAADRDYLMEVYDDDVFMEEQ